VQILRDCGFRLGAGWTFILASTGKRPGIPDSAFERNTPYGGMLKRFIGLTRRFGVTQ